MYLLHIITIIAKYLSHQFKISHTHSDNPIRITANSKFSNNNHDFECSASSVYLIQINIQETQTYTIFMFDLL